MGRINSSVGLVTGLNITDTVDKLVEWNAGASARIGNFASDIAVQDTGGGSLRLIIPTRGDAGMKIPGALPGLSARHDPSWLTTTPPS